MTTACFFDLDGTLYNGNLKIAGADSLIRQMRAQQIPFLLVTNNSSRTPQLVAHHLAELGIDVSEDEVFNSAQAAARYVAEHGPHGARVFCIGEIGMRTALEGVGVQFVESEGVADFVVQGIDRAISYEKLKRAVQLILQGATFVLTNPDLLLPWNGQLVPGAGSIGAMLQAATGRQPVVIGKPSAIIMQYALEKLREQSGQSLTFGDVWMIGDNLRTDIAAAKAVGCRSILVLTGLADEGNVQRLIAETGVEPDVICATLTELEVFLRNAKQRASRK